MLTIHIRRSWILWLFIHDTVESISRKRVDVFGQLNKKVVSLNIEPSEARVLVTQGKRILYWGSVPLAKGLIRHGIIANQSKLSATLDAFFTDASLPRDNVVVSLTATRSISRIISLPKLKSKLLEEAIRYEAEREMPVPLDELYLSWESIRSNSSQNFYYVLGVPRDLIDMQVGVLRMANIEHSVFNLKPLALARAPRSSEALIIDMEPESFDIVVIVAGFPAVMRTIVNRSDAMTIQDRIQQLSEELNRTVQFHNSSNPQSALPSNAPAFLTGSLANDPEICRLTSEVVSNPIEQLTSPFDYPADLPFPVAQYAVNLGLAIDHMSPMTIKVGGVNRSTTVNPNILPEEYRSGLIRPVKMLYPIVAILLVFIMLFIVFMKLGTDMRINEIQADINDVNEEIVELGTETEPIKAEINKLKEEENRLIEETERLLSMPAITEVSKRLQVILDEIGSGLELTSITESSRAVTVQGTATLNTSVALYVSALEESGLFTTVYMNSLSGGMSNEPVYFSIAGEY